MSFIGNDQLPAQKLKDAKLNKEQFKDAYKYCIEVRVLIICEFKINVNSIIGGEY